MSLSNEQIERLEPKDRSYKKHHELGLYISVYKTGKKVWYFRYKLNRKEGQASLGVFPEIKLEEAVIRRDESIKYILKGEKPRTYPGYSLGPKIRNISMLDLFEDAIYREITDDEIENFNKDHTHIFPKGNIIHFLRIQFIRNVLEECKQRKAKRQQYLAKKKKRI